MTSEYKYERREAVLATIDTLMLMDSQFDHSPELRPTQWNASYNTVLDGIPRFYPGYINDKEVVIKLYHAGGWLIGLKFTALSPALQDDRDVVKAMFDSCRSFRLDLFPAKRTELARKFADDKEVMLSIVTADGSLYNEAREELKNDRDVVMAAVVKGGMELGDAPASYSNDAEFVKEVVSRKPLALEKAPKGMRADPTVALAALAAATGDSDERVTVEYFFKHCISRTLRNDESFMVRAVEISPRAGEYAFSPALGKEFLKAYAKAGGSTFDGKLSEDMKGDPVFMAELVKVADKPGYAAREATEEVKNDRNFALAVITSAGDGLAYVSERLRDDDEIVRIAMGFDAEHNLRYISDRLRKNYESETTKEPTAGAAL